MRDGSRKRGLRADDVAQEVVQLETTLRGLPPGLADGGGCRDEAE